jgi:polyisoprenoid-binding protein YceI
LIFPMNRKRILVIAVVVAVVAGVGYFLFDRAFPNNFQPSVTGVPTSGGSSIDARRTAQALTASAPTPQTNGIVLLSNPRREGNSLFQTDEALYTACEDFRVSVPGGRPAATAEPTMEATMDATMAATSIADVPGETNLVRYAVDAELSEACYISPEIFLGINEFRVAVGITKSIDAEVEIDLGNVANSLVGDVTINISELKSDEGRRDGAIQNRWIETNKYPFATFTNISVVGLPTRPYVEGETLNFQLVGTLKLREAERETTFEAKATIKDDMLVVVAYTDITFSGFDIETPAIPGFVSVDDELRLLLNFVGVAGE